MGIAAEPAIEHRQLLVNHRVTADGIGEFVEFFRLGQVAVEQEIGDLHEIGLFGQLVDRVAAVQQDALIAVDIGDRALARGGRGEARIVGEIAGLGVKLANIDHVGTDRSGQQRKRMFPAGRGELDGLFGHSFGSSI